MKNYFLPLLFIVPLFSHADDVYRKNGSVIKNCTVRDTTGTSVIILFYKKSTYLFSEETSSTIQSIPLRWVDRIVVAPYDSTKSSEVVGPSLADSSAYNSTFPVIQGSTYTHPNIKLLPISFVCAALTWDYFKQADDISRTIDANNKFAKSLGLKIDNTDLESQRTRKKIFAFTFLAAGIVNTFFTFESVEVKAGPNSFSLSYTF